MNNEQIKVLNKIYSMSQDTHNILTPISICDEMINSLNIKDNKSILVVSNMEFLISLRKHNIDMKNVHYSVNCPIKKQFAINLGVSLNNIHNLEYNNKEINFGTPENMKFDYIIQNPPYNPNSIWKKFVLKCIDLLNDDGKMVAIHPDSWRTSSKHEKLCDHLKEHISELHITDFKSFDGIGISTDWYIYNKNKIINKIKLTYSNKDVEYLDLRNTNRILRFSTFSIPGRIISKICTKENNNAILLNGFDTENSIVDMINGKYKQCGGNNSMNTKWTTGEYVLTQYPTKHQFENKVVMSYTQKPRARYIKGDEEIGVLRAYYWLTDNIDANPNSIVLLLNSKLIWKLGQYLIPNIKYTKTTGVIGFYRWFLKSLNFDKLNVKTEEELYHHYGLTQEEINWIENE